MDWLNGVERHQVTQGGPWASGYPFRLVLHSTESDTFVDPLRYPVHFQADPARQRLAQLIPCTESAFGLEHVGGVETNKACAIQVEIVGRATNQPWPHEWVTWLGHVLAPVIDGCGITRTLPAYLVGRMDDTEWSRFTGVCGHAHVPNQPSGHWDPGNFDYAGFLAATLPTPTPAHGGSTMARMVAHSDNDKALVTLTDDGSELVAIGCKPFDPHDPHVAQLGPAQTFKPSSPVDEIVATADGKGILCRFHDGHFDVATVVQPGHVT